MKPMRIVLIGLLTVVVAAGCACSDRQKAPDVTQDIRHALGEAGLNDVRVSQDRDKRVVTLGGNVRSQDEKEHAEAIAKPIAGDQVVANEIGVRPKDDQGTAKKVDSDLDSGIDKNLSAMLEQHRLKDDVRYHVDNGVVTLKGDVRSESQRSSVQKLAEQVPNVKQVVNEIEVKNQRATSNK